MKTEMGRIIHISYSPSTEFNINGERICMSVHHYCGPSFFTLRRGCDIDYWNRFCKGHIDELPPEEEDDIEEYIQEPSEAMWAFWSEWKESNNEGQIR